MRKVRKHIKKSPRKVYDYQAVNRSLAAMRKIHSAYGAGEALRAREKDSETRRLSRRGRIVRFKQPFVNFKDYMMRKTAENVLLNPQCQFHERIKLDLQSREQYFAAELLEAKLAGDDKDYQKTVENDLRLIRAALFTGRFYDPETNTYRSEKIDGGNPPVETRGLRTQANGRGRIISDQHESR